MRFPRLCRERGVPLIIDASQSAGALDIDFEALGASYIAMPGHKGLYGPQGTGVLLCGDYGVPLMSGEQGPTPLPGKCRNFCPTDLKRARTTCLELPVSLPDSAM